MDDLSGPAFEHAQWELYGHGARGHHAPVFRQFFQSIAQQEGSAVALMRQDGMLLAGYPRSDDVGKIVPGMTDLRRTKTPRSCGSESPFDRQMRIVYPKPLANYPLRIAVSQTQESALHSWRSLARLSTAMAASSTVLVLLMALVAWWWRKQESLTEELRSRICGSTRPLTTWARACACSMRRNGWSFAMTAMPSCTGCRRNCCKPGTPHRAIIAYRGSRPFQRRGQRQRRRARRSPLWAPAGDATSSRIDELADGRLICVTRQPMEGGGWVATHLDVTEQQRAEAGSPTWRIMTR